MRSSEVYIFTHLHFSEHKAVAVVMENEKIKHLEDEIAKLRADYETEEDGGET